VCVKCSCIDIVRCLRIVHGLAEIRVCQAYYTVSGGALNSTQSNPIQACNHGGFVADFLATPPQKKNLTSTILTAIILWYAYCIVMYRQLPPIVFLLCKNHWPPKLWCLVLRDCVQNQYGDNGIVCRISTAVELSFKRDNCQHCGYSPLNASTYVSNSSSYNVKDVRHWCCDR